MNYLKCIDKVCFIATNLRIALIVKDYQTYQDLIMDIGSVGALVEAVEEQRFNQETRRPIERVNEPARKKLMIEQESVK